MKEKNKHIFFSFSIVWKKFKKFFTATFNALPIHTKINILMQSENCYKFLERNTIEFQFANPLENQMIYNTASHLADLRFLIFDIIADLNALFISKSINTFVVKNK